MKISYLVIVFVSLACVIGATRFWTSSKSSNIGTKEQLRTLSAEGNRQELEKALLNKSHTLDAEELRKIAHEYPILLDAIVGTTGEESKLTRTILQRAISQNDIKSVKRLIGLGVSVTEVSHFDVKSSLCWACNYCHSDLVKLFLESGADPNELSNTGTTLLHYMATSPMSGQHMPDELSGATKSESEIAFGQRMMSKEKEIVMILLRAGADPKIVNQQGEVAADVARIRGRDDLVELLLQSSEQ